MNATHEQQGHTKVEREQLDEALIRAEKVLNTVIREAREGMDKIKEILANPLNRWTREDGPDGRERHVLDGGRATIAKVTTGDMTTYVTHVRGTNGHPDGPYFFDDLALAKRHCENVWPKGSTGPWSEGCAA